MARKFYLANVSAIIMTIFYDKYQQINYIAFARSYPGL